MFKNKTKDKEKKNASLDDLDHFLDFTINKAVNIMQARAGSLLLLDQESENLYFKIATGEKKEEVKKFTVKIGQGIAGSVAKTGEPLLIEDVSKDPRWNKSISESVGFQTHSIVCVPLTIGSEVIGVVEVIDKLDGSAFKQSDLRLLTEFADMAAHAVGKARKADQFERENKDLREELGIKYEIVGDSESIKKVISEAFKVSNAKTSTLLLGESGTGKELLARLIHRAGPRNIKPMIALNCAALPETLLEDELFGHEKGAFTGAMGKKVGKFELADGGTIFLDEIGEMSPGMQAKLLRVLQEGVFYRIGGSQPISVDVRVIAATNRDIKKEVEEGNFREDLFYRLNVVQINMPPLRERKEDIPLLAEHFKNVFMRESNLSGVTISKKAVEKMLQYDWPGNVRELGNAIERAVVMGNGHTISAEDLPIADSKSRYPGMKVGLTLNDALNQFKKEFIKINLNHTNGNRSKAAQIMGIQRTYLSRLITKFELSDY